MGSLGVPVTLSAPCARPLRTDSRIRPSSEVKMSHYPRNLWHGSLPPMAIRGHYPYFPLRNQHLNVRFGVEVFALSFQDLTIETYVKISPLATQRRVQAREVHNVRARRPYRRCRIRGVSIAHRSACRIATAGLQGARLYSSPHRYSMGLATEDGQLVFGFVVGRRCKNVFCTRHCRLGRLVGQLRFLQESLKNRLWTV